MNPKVQIGLAYFEIFLFGSIFKGWPNIAKDCYFKPDLKVEKCS